MATRVQRTPRNTRTSRVDQKAPIGDGEPARPPHPAPQPVEVPARRGRVESGDVALIAYAKGARMPLNAAQQRRVEQVFREAGAVVPARLQKLGATLASQSPTAVAVFLRAVAAHATDLIAGKDMAVLEQFGAALGTMTDTDILRRCTALDLLPQHNDNSVDAQQLWDRRGTTADRTAPTDTDGQNDGLIQRFTSTCGPTTLQMMMAEADPIFALSLHGAGVGALTTDDPVARFQRSLLEAHGGVVRGRIESFELARLKNVLGRLQRSGELSRPDKLALLAHVEEGAAESAAAARVLKLVRERTGGFPDAQAVRRLRAERWPVKDEGLSTAGMLELVHTHLSPLTGARYRELTCGRGRSARHLDDVAKSLRRGHDVVLGISEPGHWMLASAVRGRASAREYLISDPDGGRTAWVSEHDLVKGTFADTQFHLPSAGERPYIDTFLIAA